MEQRVLGRERLGNGVQLSRTVAGGAGGSSPALRRRHRRARQPRGFGNEELAEGDGRWSEGERGSGRQLRVLFGIGAGFPEKAWPRDRFAALAAAADAVVTNPSMLVHVAAAFHKPTVVVLGQYFASARQHDVQWGYPGTCISLGRDAGHWRSRQLWSWRCARWKRDVS